MFYSTLMVGGYAAQLGLSVIDHNHETKFQSREWGDIPEKVADRQTQGLFSKVKVFPFQKEWLRSHLTKRSHDLAKMTFWWCTSQQLLFPRIVLRM
jgi:hypothetical protein